MHARYSKHHLVKVYGTPGKIAGSRFLSCRVSAVAQILSRLLQALSPHPLPRRLPQALDAGMDVAPWEATRVMITLAVGEDKYRFGEVLHRFG